MLGTSYEANTLQDPGCGPGDLRADKPTGEGDFSADSSGDLPLHRLHVTHDEGRVAHLSVTGRGPRSIAEIHPPPRQVPYPPNSRRPLLEI